MHKQYLSHISEVLYNLTGELALMIFRGPLEMLGGVAAGAIIGIILWYVPNGKQVTTT